MSGFNVSGTERNSKPVEYSGYHTVKHSEETSKGSDPSIFVSDMLKGMFGKAPDNVWDQAKAAAHRA